MTKFPTLLLFFLLVTIESGYSQLDPYSIMGMTTATSKEILATKEAPVGAMIYGTDTQLTYQFNGSEWKILGTAPKVHFGSILLDSTGDISVSGLPFKPSQILFTAYANIDARNLNDDNSTGRNNDRTKENYHAGADGYARMTAGTIEQQTISVGGSANSINDISRYASDSHCIGIRYANQNGDFLGLTTATLKQFNRDGFTLTVDNLADNLLILYQAYE